MIKSLGRPPPNADIVSFIYHLIQKLPLRVKLDWVRSHQDETSKQKTPLSSSALLNVRADSIAYTFLAEHPIQNSEHFPHMNASLLIGKIRIHSSTAHQIHTAIQEEAYREFFVRKHKITFVYDSIHWEAFSSALGKTTHQKKTMLTKFIHGCWLPTGERRFFLTKGTPEWLWSSL